MTNDGYSVSYSGTCCCDDGSDGVRPCCNTYIHHVKTDDREINFSITINSPDSQRAKDCEEGQKAEKAEKEEDKED